MRNLLDHLERHMNFLLTHTEVDASLKVTVNMSSHLRLRIELAHGIRQSLTLFVEKQALRVIETTAGLEKLSSFYIRKEENDHETYLELLQFLHAYITRARLKQALDLVNHFEFSLYQHACKPGVN